MKTHAFAPISVQSGGKCIFMNEKRRIFTWKMRNAIYKIGRSEDIWVRQQWKPSTVCETSPPFMLRCFVLKTDNSKEYLMHPETSLLASSADKTRTDVQHKLQVKNAQKIIVVAHTQKNTIEGFSLLFCASNFYSYKTPIIGITNKMKICCEKKCSSV